MVSVLWRHGPQMLDQMQKKGIKWPHFEAREMSDVIALSQLAKEMNREMEFRCSVGA
jgi:hypothetical protein